MEIQKQYLESAITLLEGVEIEARGHSRKRTAFANKLREDMRQFLEDMENLRMDFAPKGEDEKPIPLMDEEGEVRRRQDGKPIFEVPFENREEFQKAGMELAEEKIVWEKTGDNAATYEAIISILEEWPGTLKGPDAGIYGILCDTFIGEEPV